jgi:hypothetical protein
VRDLVANPITRKERTEHVARRLAIAASLGLEVVGREEFAAICARNRELMAAQDERPSEQKKEG